MSDERTKQSFDIYGDQLEWLKKMVADHGLPDEGKALRCLINYAIEDGNLEEIFDTIRCRHC